MHPLYTWKTFQALSHKQKIGVVKDNKLCLNCLGSGHFVKVCLSTHRCKKCHRSHHLWLHSDSKREDRKAAKAGQHSQKLAVVVTTNVSHTVQHKHLLLMTCKFQILHPDRSTTQAKALLDSGLSTSLISKRLVQRHGLKPKQLNLRISGIGRNPYKLSPWGYGEFQNSPSEKWRKTNSSAGHFAA